MSPHAAGPSRGAVSTPNKTPSIKHYRGMVTLVIGSSKKDFTVHKDLLIFYSDYFRAAFNGSFSESTASKIELLDVKKKVFENFHTWLYMRKLSTEDDEALDFRPLVDLWIFGDRFQVPMLQNCVMDEIVARQRRGDSSDVSLLKVAYDNTVDNSPLRKVLIEDLAYDAILGHEEESVMNPEYRKLYTVEQLQDLVKELYTARENKTPYGKWPKRDKCYFHVHGKDEHC
ncbi:hypothetical protein KCU73_g7214, partial [Aureobasidium melanogenum]